MMTQEWAFSQIQVSKVNAMEAHLQHKNGDQVQA